MGFWVLVEGISGQLLFWGIGYESTQGNTIAGWIVDYWVDGLEAEQLSRQAENEDSEETAQDSGRGTE